MRRRHLPLLLFSGLASATTPAQDARRGTSAGPGGALYSGTVVLHVDATDLDHRIWRVRQTLPVSPGPFDLALPRWIPGHHAPSGDATLMAGLVMRGGGERLAWQRDPLDTHVFRVEIPDGARTLELEFQHLSPVNEGSGRVVMTREMMNVQWHNLLLAPAGHPARSISFRASLTLPMSWAWAGALRSARRDGTTVHFEPVSLDMLVDSPLFAGAHHRRVELEPVDTARPVVLNVFADSASHLDASDAQLDAHRRLVRQADLLFGSRPFAHYDFLLALSERMGGIGLEHHQSSENAVKPNYFKDWDKAARARELLPHEYAHAWNGKYRRPQDLSTPDFNQPMRNSLLWIYEGQTEYWGKVLAVRSGLVDPDQARERLAGLAASLTQRVGRGWRNLQDTTHDAIIALRRDKRDWVSWQRSRRDYYGEAVLIWLEADMLIREASDGARSLDDFARAFFGGRDGDLGPLTYTFDDVVAALGRVHAHDWAQFLRLRLDSHAPASPLDGLTRAGWRLAWADTPSRQWETNEADWRFSDFSHSLGFVMNHDGKLSDVVWEGVAFKAGLAPGTTLVAVNQMAYKAEGLKDAIRANRDGRTPIELLLRDGDRFFSVRIDWRGGLRYPKLERIDGRADRLATLFAAR